MVNALTQFLGIKCPLSFQSRKAAINITQPKYFELLGHKVASDRIANVSIKKGCVQFDRSQEPTLQISLNHESSESPSNAKHELVFAGDQADKALDELGKCGYFDELEIQVKKRVFLNARFAYQDDLFSNHSMHSYTNQTSGIH